MLEVTVKVCRGVCRSSFLFLLRPFPVSRYRSTRVSAVPFLTRLSLSPRIQRGDAGNSHSARRKKMIADRKSCSSQGGYIFYAGASLAGAGYCRQCRRRPAILPLQLRQGCQVCVKISTQRFPRVAQFNAC